MPYRHKRDFRGRGRDPAAPRGCGASDPRKLRHGRRIGRSDGIDIGPSDRLGRPSEAGEVFLPLGSAFPQKTAFWHDAKISLSEEGVRPEGCGKAARGRNTRPKANSPSMIVGCHSDAPRSFPVTSDCGRMPSFDVLGPIQRKHSCLT